jgi:endonuclease G
MRSGVALVVLAVAAGCAHAPEKRQPHGHPATDRPALPPLASVRFTGGVHAILGIPLDADPHDDLLIDRRYWVASYNPKRHVPNWVAWRVVAADLGVIHRRDSFRPDDLLPFGIVAVKATDYRGSGHDRGHMCPSADRTATAEANDSTFLMTNMQPQLHALNAGPWEGLETYERELAMTGKQVQIVAGGIFGPATSTIGPGIAVPTANFKIVVVLEPGQTAAEVGLHTRVFAVVMPNSPSAARTRWPQYLVSVDEVERRSGYDFLRDVRDEIEVVIEARVAEPLSGRVPAPVPFIDTPAPAPVVHLPSN